MKQKDCLSLAYHCCALLTGSWLKLDRSVGSVAAPLLSCVYFIAACPWFLLTPVGFWFLWFTDWKQHGIYIFTLQLEPESLFRLASFSRCSADSHLQGTGKLLLFVILLPPLCSILTCINASSALCVCILCRRGYQQLDARFYLISIDCRNMLIALFLTSEITALVSFFLFFCWSFLSKSSVKQVYLLLK